MEEDLEQKLSESNVAQIEETKIKVKERIRTIEGRTKSIENEQETINKGVFSYKEQSARQAISQNKVEEMEETEESDKKWKKRMRMSRERIPTDNLNIKAHTFFERWSGFIFFLLLLPLTVFASMLLTGNNIALMRGRGNRHLNGLQPTSNMEAIPQSPFASSMSFAELPHQNFPSDFPSYHTETNTTSGIEESEINSSSSTSTSHFDNLFVANEEQLKPDLKVALTVTLKGAHMHIPDTGVELDIPTGAVKRKRLIEMTIIPFDKQYASTADFSSNSSVAVELLPNKAIFSLPVHLQLPHCLQLKRNYKEIKNPVKVFVSHHKTGPPVWEEDSIASANCTLEEDHCVIHLKQFCWVKYEIDDKIVVAKRLKVFTAGKSLHPSDHKTEIEVGYYMDLPGRAEDMTASLGMEFYQTKRFIFVIDGELPLQLLLSKIVPKEWTYITPEENPKNIPYKSVVGDKDTSCPFALETLSSSERKPLCIFKIVQGNESVELSMRF